MVKSVDTRGDGKISKE
jgi:hypothetical protein